MSTPSEGCVIFTIFLAPKTLHTKDEKQVKESQDCAALILHNSKLRDVYESVWLGAIATSKDNIYCIILLNV